MRNRTESISGLSMQVFKWAWAGESGVKYNLSALRRATISHKGGKDGEAAADG